MRIQAQLKRTTIKNGCASVPRLLISIAFLVAGGIVGCLCGMALGWLLSLGYQRQGPNDVADAPAYVTLGLIYIGALCGAGVGLALGIIFTERLERMNADRRSGDSGRQNQIPS